MSLIHTVPELPDLAVEFPSSASDFYAFQRAELMRPGTRVYCFEQVRLTVDYSQSWQFKFSLRDKDGHYISALPQLYDVPESSHCVTIDETVGFIDDKFTKFNVCHYLLDKLYRITELGDNNIDSYFVFDQNAYVKTVSDYLGINLTDLHRGDSTSTTYSIKKLYISDSTFVFQHPGHNYRPEIKALLKTLQGKIPSDSNLRPSKRLFIDRLNAQTRKIVNHTEFTHLLNTYGFTSILLENMSIAEQVHAFEHAEIVIGVHGAGLTNMVFCEQSNVTLLEIIPPLCATSDYWELAAGYNFNYDAFIADDPEHPRPDYATWIHNPAKYNRQDVMIDLSRFEDFLNSNIASMGAPTTVHAVA